MLIKCTISDILGRHWTRTCIIMMSLCVQNPIVILLPVRSCFLLLLRLCLEDDHLYPLASRTLVAGRGAQPHGGWRARNPRRRGFAPGCPRAPPGGPAVDRGPVEYALYPPGSNHFTTGVPIGTSSPSIAWACGRWSRWRQAAWLDAADAIVGSAEVHRLNFNQFQISF